MFTVMTWNVENFFAPDAGETDAYQQKVTELAQIIKAANPDVVALQEVGDPESFEALRAKLDLNWTGELATHFDPNHAIRVGWLSPRPLADVEEVVDLPAQLAPVKVDDSGKTITQLGRGALAVTCTTDDGTPVRLLTCHLKSKLLDFPGNRFNPTDETERARYTVYALDRRAAEAAAVRDWATATLTGEWAGKPVLVCGDLNDTPEAATTQLLLGPPGSQIGTAGFNRPDAGDAQRLWETGYAMLAPDNYSRIDQGRKELIDHVLVSQALVTKLLQAATVPLDIPSIGVQPTTAPRSDPPSDHRPVVTRFDI